MSKTRFSGRLPNGKSAKSQREYLKAWGDLIGLFEKFTGWKVYSCDPDFGVNIPHTKINFQLPMDVIEKIIELGNKSEDVEKKLTRESIRANIESMKQGYWTINK